MVDRDVADGGAVTGRFGLEERLSRCAAALACFACVGGLVTLAGWWIGVYRLTDWAGLGISMKANAAVAAMACGAGLLMQSLRLSPIAVRIAGVAAATIGGLTLFEHLAGANLGIDELLAHEAPGMRATAAPGRMGPPASSSFLALGTALVLLTLPGRTRTIAAGLATLAFGISLLSLTGYLYQAELMFSAPGATGISLQMAAILFALATGTAFLAPDQPPAALLVQPTSAGLFARRILPAILVLPLVLGWLRLQGEAYGLYDHAFGSALRSLLETILLAGLLWWAAATVGAYERSSRASERKLADVLASIADGFVTLDAQTRFAFVNDEAARLMRRSREELIGRSCDDAFAADGDAPFCGAFRRVLVERADVAVEEFDPAAKRWYATRAYLTADGGVAAYIQDVTEKKESEEQLRRHQRALEEADRRKDEFLATLAHELRNPLSPIRTSVELLELTETDPETRELCGIMRGQVDHMVRLVDDLLEVSRITRGTISLQKSIVDLRLPVRRAVDANAPLMQQRGQRLAYQEPEEPILVAGDEVRLTQVFSNLLHNASKYSDERGRIELNLAREGDLARATVRDDGVGIPPEMLSRVFEMFVQVDRTSRRAQGGLGIGLTLVERLVAMHGGSIAAESEGAGRGSVFTVRLPTAAPADVTALAEEDAGGALLPERRVLIVDDNVAAAATLAKLVRAVGSQAEVAHDGPSALEIVARYQPEIVLLDLGMPGMDGLEVARRIRAEADSRPVTIAAVTGWSQESDRAKTRAAGFDAHFVKPVTAEALRGLLATREPSPLG